MTLDEVSFDTDAYLSYDADGAGLCFRWECVEPATCKENTIIGATVLQGAGKDKVCLFEVSVS